VDTTQESETLLAELLERSEIVAELGGPQIEAWVSGLFPIFHGDVTAERFVSYCNESGSDHAGLLCAALATIADGDLAALAAEVARGIDVNDAATARQIGSSVASQAWKVEAPFGTSLVIGFDTDDSAFDPAIDTSHSILIELGDLGQIDDLQLAGAPQELLAEAAEEGDRVRVHAMPIEEVAIAIAGAWPHVALDEGSIGPGLLANQMFVRARLRDLLPEPLPVIEVAGHEVDVQRGMSDAEFADANRAALSTLQSAVGAPPAESSVDYASWVGVVRGDGGVLSARERDGLLWLEWADWLGAGIGLLRAGVGSAVTGATLVDFVNRCPEVSSTVSAADRDYAEWAFEVAIDLLTDAGAVADGVLTQGGYDSLHGGLAAAWSQP